MMHFKGQAAKMVEITDANAETVTVRLENGDSVSGVSLDELLGDEDEVVEEYKRIEYVRLGLSLLRQHLQPNDGLEGSDLEKVRKVILGK